MEYFSDRENGPKARIHEEISPQVWGGIIAVIHAANASGAFGSVFPENCPDGNGVIGSDENSFMRMLHAEIPDIEWPLCDTKEVGPTYFTTREPFAPHVLCILDLLEFCHRNIAKPIQGSYHSYFSHHHLSYDVLVGQAEFRSSINRIFARNGISYELATTGQIIRLAPPVMRELMAVTPLKLGDAIFDEMFEDARKRFYSPRLPERKIALEKLWDCWERIKSTEDRNKKTSVEKLLERASVEPKFRATLDKEAHELTEIGNSYQIRHSEVSQQPIENEHHFDYLFHRMYSMLTLLIRRKFE